MSSHVMAVQKQKQAFWAHLVALEEIFDLLNVELIPKHRDGVALLVSFVVCSLNGGYYLYQSFLA